MDCASTDDAGCADVVRLPCELDAAVQQTPPADAFPLALAERLIRLAPEGSESALQRLVAREREKTRSGVRTAGSKPFNSDLDAKALLELAAWSSTHGDIGLRASFLSACERVARETSLVARHAASALCGKLEGERFGALEGSTPAPAPVTLSLGCPLLDQVVCIRCGAVTEVYGEAGSGKTQFLLQLAARNRGMTLYLHTENGRFPSERLVDIARATASSADNDGNDIARSPESILNRILVETGAHVARSPLSLSRYIRGPFRKFLEHSPDPKLLIIDSIAAVIRHAYENRKRGALSKRARWVFRFVNTLRLLMREYRSLAVVASNQVAQRADGELVPALGAVWSQCVNTRIRLQRSVRGVFPSQSDAASTPAGALRSASVCFSDWGPEPGTLVTFQIDESGVHGQHRGFVRSH